MANQNFIYLRASYVHKSTNVDPQGNVIVDGEWRVWDQNGDEYLNCGTSLEFKYFAIAKSGINRLISGNCAHSIPVKGVHRPEVDGVIVNWNHVSGLYNTLCFKLFGENGKVRLTGDVTKDNFPEMPNTIVVNRDLRDLFLREQMEAR
jgi:hypothetical protein